MHSYYVRLCACVTRLNAWRTIAEEQLGTRRAHNMLHYFVDGCRCDVTIVFDQIKLQSKFG